MSIINKIMKASIATLPRTPPLTIGSTRRISHKNVMYWLNNVEESGNKNHSNCVKKCLEDKPAKKS